MTKNVFVKAIELHFGKAGISFKAKDIRIALHAAVNEYNEFMYQLHIKHNELVDYAALIIIRW